VERLANMVLFTRCNIKGWRALVKKVALITALLAVSLSLGGCFVGKGPAPIGKGKAPAPVVTRG
jgi:hypothetical protein